MPAKARDPDPNIDKLKKTGHADNPKVTYRRDAWPLVLLTEHVQSADFPVDWTLVSGPKNHEAKGTIHLEDVMASDQKLYKKLYMGDRSFKDMNALKNVYMERPGEKWQFLFVSRTERLCEVYLTAN